VVRMKKTGRGSRGEKEKEDMARFFCITVSP
jgi:hypothetical protein